MSPLCRNFSSSLSITEGLFSDPDLIYFFSLHLLVPLSLSRTFVVSRTELLAAGTPGKHACFLFTLVATVRTSYTHLGCLYDNLLCGRDAGETEVLRLH